MHLLLCIAHLMEITIQVATRWLSHTLIKIFVVRSNAWLEMVQQVCPAPIFTLNVVALLTLPWGSLWRDEVVLAYSLWAWWSGASALLAAKWRCHWWGVAMHATHTQQDNKLSHGQLTCWDAPSLSTWHPCLLSESFEWSPTWLPRPWMCPGHSLCHKDIASHSFSHHPSNTKCSLQVYATWPLWHHPQRSILCNYTLVFSKQKQFQRRPCIYSNFLPGSTSCYQPLWQTKSQPAIILQWSTYAPCLLSEPFE